jgi:hypothetical protein
MGIANDVVSGVSSSYRRPQITSVETLVAEEPQQVLVVQVLTGRKVEVRNLHRDFGADEPSRERWLGQKLGGWVRSQMNSEIVKVLSDVLDETARRAS